MKVIWIPGVLKTYHINVYIYIQREIHLDVVIYTFIYLNNPKVAYTLGIIPKDPKPKDALEPKNINLEVGEML